MIQVFTYSWAPCFILWYHQRTRRVYHMRCYALTTIFSNCLHFFISFLIWETRPSLSFITDYETMPCCCHIYSVTFTMMDSSDNGFAVSLLLKRRRKLSSFKLASCCLYSQQSPNLGGKTSSQSSCCPCFVSLLPHMYLNFWGSAHKLKYRLRHSSQAYAYCLCM